MQDDEICFFPPNDDPESIPVLRVEGVRVGVYRDRNTGTLNVAVDLEEASEYLVSAQGTVPIQVSIGDRIVYDAL